MIKPAHSLCRVQSNAEREVHAASAFCKRCQLFNGMVDKSHISCKRPDA